MHSFFSRPADSRKSEDAHASLFIGFNGFGNFRHGRRIANQEELAIAAKSPPERITQPARSEAKCNHRQKADNGIESKQQPADKCQLEGKHGGEEQHGPEECSFERVPEGAPKVLLLDVAIRSG